jgi:hypothetical protein
MFWRRPSGESHTIEANHWPAATYFHIEPPLEEIEQYRTVREVTGTLQDDVTEEILTYDFKHESPYFDSTQIPVYRELSERQVRRVGNSIAKSLAKQHNLNVVFTGIFKAEHLNGNE